MEGTVFGWEYFTDKTRTDVLYPHLSIIDFGMLLTNTCRRQKIDGRFALRLHIHRQIGNPANCDSNHYRGPYCEWYQIWVTKNGPQGAESHGASSNASEYRNSRSSHTRQHNRLPIDHKCSA